MFLGCLSICAYMHLGGVILRPHTHTHLFNGPFSGTTQVYQKGKTNLDFTEARNSERQ